MKIDSKLFRRSLCAVLLSVSTIACSAPGQPDAGSTPGTASSPQAGQATPFIGLSPVAMTVTDKKVGEGESVDDAAAFLARVLIWEDKIEGKPMGKGDIEMLVVPGSGQMPGLVKAVKGLKVGGIKDIEISAKELFGEMPPGARMNPARPMYIRVEAKEIFPEEEFKIETTKEGTGDREAADGDILRVHYTGRLDNPKDGKVFDTSRDKGQPFTVPLGEGQVIPGWEKGLQGMKAGEVRNLSIPHYYAYGIQEKGDIPPKSRLYFEVELVEIVQPGELKSETTKPGEGTAIESKEKGSFHYTGWLDGFDGEKKFDSSRDRNQPFDVQIGVGRVIKGWDEGLVGMKPGEVRRLTIPYNLAYGPKGSPPTIPPFATLYFEVEYLGPAK